MLDHFRQIGLWSALAIMMTIMIVNGLYMLVSPTAWFALPGWLRLNGVMSAKKYGTGWGAIQVRVLGGIVLGTILWMAFSLLAQVTTS